MEEEASASVQDMGESAAPAAMDVPEPEPSEADTIFRELAEKLESPDLTIALKAAKQMRERLDVLHMPDGPASYLRRAHPVLKRLVATLPVQETDNATQQLREAAIDVLGRGFGHEAVRALRLLDEAREVLDLAVATCRVDNEDAAILALRLAIDTHRAFRSGFADRAPQVAAFLEAFYNAAPRNVEAAFSEEGARRAAEAAAVVAQRKAA
ncbi:unnamed protein product, partial [Phaeothamnion confervicola]